MITVRLQHKDGKIIDAPKAGVASLLALGWEPIDPPQDPSSADEAKGPKADNESAGQDGEDGEAKAKPDAEGESEDGEAKAKPAAQKRGGRRQVPKPGDDA